MFITKDMMTKKWARDCITKHRHPKGWVDVEFDDGVVEMPIQALLIHIPCFELCVTLKMPLLKKYIFTLTGPYNAKVFSNAFTKIYADFVLREDLSKKDIQQFKQAIYEEIVFLNDFGNFELAEHHCGMSLVELAHIATDEQVSKIINVDLKSATSSAQVEKILSHANAELTQLIGTRGALKDNILQVYQEAEALNYAQMSQVLIAFGPRSEINDKVYDRPVYGSSLSGMRDIVDAAIEHLGARKAVYYNHEAIKKSQYFGRKEHLIACSIENLYSGDCGSTVFIPFTLKSFMIKNCMGKYIYDNNRLVLLTANNFERYVDKTVLMRSAITCRHTDGVCETCMGILSRNLTPGINIGINSATNVVERISQMILKTKHIGQTKSKLYQIPKIADEFFERGSSGICLKKRYRDTRDEWYIGVCYEHLRGSVSDLHSLNKDDTLAIPEERLSDITAIYVKDSDGNNDLVSMEVDGQTPYLTADFMYYMKDHYNELIQDENVVWVPMRDCKYTPIFRTTISTDSMMGFVNTVVKVLESGKLARYKDAGAALQDFAELCYDKVSTHISHLEVILKAHLVSSKHDWSIPIVTDPKNVKFSKTVRIIQNRSVSMEMALQGHKKYFSSARTYTTLHEQGPFDVYLDIA